jgi:membrane-bound lytic murein transglycosylase A
MKNSISALSWCLTFGVLISSWQTALALPLKSVESNNANLGLDRKLEGEIANTRDRSATTWNESQRQDLQQAIDNSLYYLSTPKATQAYSRYTSTEFNLDRVRNSLIRFRQLLVTSISPEQLQQAVKAEFIFYQSTGKDNLGTVDFTGYFEPVYSASPVPTSDYRYPLYSQPDNFKTWGKHHPTRAQLEGMDGLLGNKSILAGNELVWFRDRLEAFLVQVQGSARLQLTDGRIMTVGYGGTTNYPYISIGGELVKDGVFSKEELSLPKLIAYFQANPAQLDKYIPRNNRFVFFRETHGAAPTGSLGISVTADRSIATDKSLMPPGALALISAPIPEVDATGNINTQLVDRYVLDQDTGSAIEGAGRIDIFLGTGKIAGERAGRLNGSGKLYYLLLKE